MIEEWKPVFGFEDRYLVSNLGGLISLAFRGNGQPKRMVTTKNYAGYHVITLGPERKQKRLHVLVLEAFVGPRPTGLQGCHGDNNKDNNRLDNLRWDTPKGNTADRQSYKGSKNPNAKLILSDVLEIRRRRLAGEKLAPIAKDFGVSTTRISQLC